MANIMYDMCEILRGSIRACKIIINTIIKYDNTVQYNTRCQVLKNSLNQKCSRRWFSFSNSWLHRGEILLDFFVVSQHTGIVRPLPGDCPYHRFFLIRHVFFLPSLDWRLAAATAAVVVVSPDRVFTFFGYERQRERADGSGQEECVDMWRDYYHIRNTIP